MTSPISDSLFPLPYANHIQRARMEKLYGELPPEGAPLTFYIHPKSDYCHIPTTLKGFFERFPHLNPDGPKFPPHGRAPTLPFLVSEMSEKILLVSDGSSSLERTITSIGARARMPGSK